MPALKKERVELRITKKEKETLEEAAILKGTTVSSLVTSFALPGAEEIIEEHKRLFIDDKQWNDVMDTLLNPPEATPLMKEIINMSLEDSWPIQLKQ